MRLILHESRASCVKPAPRRGAGARFLLAAACAFGLCAIRPLSALSQQEPVQLKATLVQVPVAVTNRQGRFIDNLAGRDFSLFEDGKRQEIALFSALKQPFTAALVLDTSNLASDRLTAIRTLALGFTRQLTTGDRMMVVTFDNEVRKLTEFTSDHSEIETAIKATESGFGKLLYEALSQALESLRDVEGRRALILFSDGVDMKSIEANADQVIKLAEEVGAVVYVMKTETRWWVEAEARSHVSAEPNNKIPIHVDGRIPLPPDYGGPDPTPTGIPKPKAPRIEVNPPQRPPVIYDNGTRVNLPGDQDEDAITKALNKLYGEADAFIQQITTKTGGRVLAAGTFEGTRSAFASVAEELRNQYLLGFYPTQKKDDRYRKLKVEVSRKDAIVRARPGYRLND